MSGEHWTNTHETKRALVEDSAGPVLFCENGKVFVNDGEGHVMLLGTSGSGKSRRCLIPYSMTVIRKLQSLVVIDPKAEIWEAVKEMVSDQYEVHVIDLRNIFNENNEGWNPLSAPYKLWISGKRQDRYAAEQMLEDLAHTMYPDTTVADPFWINQAIAVFLSVCYVLFDYAKPEQINLASCYYVVAKGDERYGASTYLKEFCKMAARNENVAMGLQAYLTTASETAGGIRAVYLDGLSKYARSISVREFLSHDELRINELRGDKPTFIDIILPDEMRIYDELVAALCSQLMHHYIRIAEQVYKGKLPIRVNFLLDELGNIGGSLKNTLPHLLTAGRSRNIRCGIVLQSLAQLKNIFGSDNAQTIIGNCDVRVTYRVNDYDTLSELSRLCGEKEIERDGHLYREPLITPTQLASMETGQALVMVSGRLKFITWLPDYTELLISHYRAKKTANVSRRRKSKYSYFDIQRYVKDKKAESIPERAEYIPMKKYPVNDSYDPRELAVFGDPRIHNESDDKQEVDKVLDDLIAQLDKQIEELEAEEKATDNKSSANQKDVTVFVTCNTRIIDKVAKLVASKSSISYADAKKELKSDCLIVKFHSNLEATLFVSEVNDLGGSAWIDFI